MMKFNDLGLDVIQLKEALLSDYPAIVKRSLVMSVERLKEGGLIDEEIAHSLENDALSLEDFHQACLSKELLLKSKEDLIQAYEEKRMAISRYLNHTLEQHKIHSYSYIEQDSIVFVKTLYFGYSEATQYFGVTEGDCKKLFEPHGFIFQYTALRFPTVLKEFIETTPTSDLIILNSTPVFYVKESKSFAIDFIIEVKIETFEQYSNEELSTPIIETIEALSHYISEKIIYHEEFNPADEQKQRYGFGIKRKQQNQEIKCLSEGDKPKETETQVPVSNQDEDKEQTIELEESLTLNEVASELNNDEHEENPVFTLDDKELMIDEIEVDLEDMGLIDTEPNLDDITIDLI